MAGNAPLRPRSPMSLDQISPIIHTTRSQTKLIKFSGLSNFRIEDKTRESLKNHWISCKDSKNIIQAFYYLSVASEDLETFFQVILWLKLKCSINALKFLVFLCSLWMTPYPIISDSELPTKNMTFDFDLPIKCFLTNFISNYEHHKVLNLLF